MTDNKTAKYYLVLHRKDIEDSLQKRLWHSAIEDSTRLIGIALFAWQCEIIDHDEWIILRDFAWESRKIAKKQINEI